jgi:DNA-binding Lrp family transcriptional regulator
VALKLNNIDEKLEAEIGEYLHTLPSIWVGYMYGEWDIMFGVLVKGPLEFDSHMSKIMQKFGQHISEKAICIQVNDFFLDYNHIYEKYSNEQIESFKEESDDIVILDDFDKQIIAHLYDNARISYLEISQKMNVSPGLIKKRIIKLEKNKVIKRYMTSMDRTQLGYRKYKTLLYFNNLSLEVKNKVLTYCLSIPNITHVTTTTGSWDLEIDYDAKDLTEFHTLFRDFRNKFSSQLVDYSVLLSYNYKYINPLKQIKL